MNAPEVDTWFFEKLDFTYPDVLSIKLVEGVKSAEKEYVLPESDNPLGPYFSVKVKATSRCVRVVFEDVCSFQVVDESLITQSPEMEGEQLFGPVKKCSSMEYRRYIENDSIIAQAREGDYSAYYLWTEDQVLFILASSEPSIMVSDEQPNLDLERCNVYFNK